MVTTPDWKRKQDEWFRQFEEENRQRSREVRWDYLKANFLAWAIIAGVTTVLATLLF